MNDKTIYWAVALKENGDLIEDAIEERAVADILVARLEWEDKQKGIYEDNAYEVVSYEVSR